MNHVLFQQEAADVTFAPLIVLLSQLVKAATATARAFFPFEPSWLATLALAGNLLLMLAMLTMRSASLW